MRQRSRSPPPPRERRESYSRGSYGGDRNGRGGRGRGGRDFGSRGRYNGGRESRDRDYTSSRRDYVAPHVNEQPSYPADESRAPKVDRNYDNSIFVRNIPFESTSRDIEDLFRDAGRIVRADIVTHRGQSRGMATVEFAHKDDVRVAISKFDNIEYRGREIHIRQDLPPPEKRNERNDRGDRGDRRDRYERTDRYERSDRGDRGDRGDRFAKQSNPPPPGTEVFVGNLPFSVTWQLLKDMMREAGDVARADVRTDSWGKSRGFGTVVFEAVESAERAVEMFQGYMMEGRRIDIRPGRVFNQASNAGNGQSFERPPRESRSAEPVLQNSEFTAGVGPDGSRSNIIFAGNLPWVTNVDDLYELFETIGRVTKAEVQYNDRGKPSGNAVIEFELEELADLAIANLNGYNYGGRDLKISYARREGEVPHNDVSEPAPPVEEDMAIEETVAAPAEETMATEAVSEPVQVVEETTADVPITE